MIAKLQYRWVEGEQEECFVSHENKTDEQFEEDLKKIKEIVKKNKYHADYGLSEFIACPPGYYELVKAYLGDFGYYINNSYYDTYDVDYLSETEMTISRKDVKTKWVNI